MHEKEKGDDFVRFCIYQKSISFSGVYPHLTTGTEEVNPLLKVKPLGAGFQTCSEPGY